MNTASPRLPELPGISPETLAAAGVRAVTSQQARDYGFVGNGYGTADLAGLLFPYPYPRTPGRTLMHRLRPDVALGDRKYLHPTGETNHLYLPNATTELLAAVAVPAIITEGEKKSLALVDALKTKALIVGLGGVWSWRTSDKAKRPNRDNGGSHAAREHSRPIEELDWIQWKGRTVYIAFDSDAAKNEQVQNAEDALARELKKRGADVRVAVLPPGDSGEKVGIDDWLAQFEPKHRPAELRRLFDGAAPRRRLTPQTDDSVELQWKPRAGFLKLFDEYADAETDAPAEFRPFTALAALGAVVGRRVSVRWYGQSDLALNNYMVLLAESSYAHKSTMLSMGRRLVQEVQTANLLPNDFTYEALVSALAERSDGLLTVQEFAGLLARVGRDYNSGTREFLMEMYDGGDYRRKLQKADVTIIKPALSILGASATSWLSQAMKEGDLKSGFFNRFCFVIGGPQKRCYALPDSRPGAYALLPLLVDNLRQVAEISGTADLSAIRAPYERWYHAKKREAEQSAHVGIVSPFYTRLAATAIKFAALIELSTSRNLKITTESLDEAIALVEYLQRSLRRLLDAEFAPTPFARETQRVLDVIRKKNGITRSEIQQQTGFKPRDRDEHLTVLIERDAIYEDKKRFFIR